MLRIWLAVAALGIAQDASTPRTSPETLSAIRAILDHALADYPSARFREVRVVTRPSNTFVHLAVCGSYNARTRGGGYGGWTRFAILNDRMEVAEGDLIGRRTWSVWCEGSDVVVLDPDITDEVGPTNSPTD